MLLKRFLQRGDRLAIEAGRIILTPQSGKQAAADAWLADNHDLLLSEIVEITSTRAFVYHGYSRGKYGRSKAGGVTLNLTNVDTGEQAFCVFNVNVTRDKNTRHGEKGSMLPAGHFNPPKGGEFILFWKRCGLPMPRRLSSFHDYMGKLRRIIFTAEYDEGEKVDKQSLQPLEISYQHLLESTGIAANNAAVSPDNFRTTSGHSPDNFRTKSPDKETLKPAYLLGLQANLGTGQNQYGKTVNGNAVIRHAPIPNEIDEWLNEYGAASNE